ncbi:hypothetical protein DFH28DRAFT_897392 [Melampsora americana]|nr:hypothetical protein DFH28DRAFT_897392 [Melampsora americana]
MALPRFCSSKNSRSSLRDTTGSITLSEKPSLSSSIGSFASRRPHKPKHLKVIVPQLGDEESSMSSKIEKTPRTGLRQQFERLKRNSQSSLSISNLIIRKSKNEKRRTTVNGQSCWIAWPQSTLETRFRSIPNPDLVQELYSIPPSQDDESTASLNLFSFTTQDRRGSCSGGIDFINQSRTESSKGISHRISHEPNQTEIQLTLKRKSYDRKPSIRHKSRAQSYSTFSFLDPNPTLISNGDSSSSNSTDVLEITLKASLNPSYSNHPLHTLHTIPSSPPSAQEALDDEIHHHVQEEEEEEEDDRSSFCTVSDRESILEFEPYCFPKWPEDH